MDRWRQARELIWEAIVEAGGPYAVARAADLHPTLLYAWRKGSKGLGEDSIAALRAQVPSVDDAVWGAALARVSADEVGEAVQA